MNLAVGILKKDVLLSAYKDLCPPQVSDLPVFFLTLYSGLMPLPSGMPNLPNLPNLPNFNLPAPHIMPGVGLPELGNPGMLHALPS